MVGEPRIDRSNEGEVRLEGVISALRQTLSEEAFFLQVVVVPLRVNVNLKAVTVEELIARRKVPPVHSRTRADARAHARKNARSRISSAC